MKKPTIKQRPIYWGAAWGRYVKTIQEDAGFSKEERERARLEFERLTGRKLTPSAKPVA